MKINLREVAKSDVLAGAVNGTRVLSSLLSRTAEEPLEPEPFFLDFSAIEVATVSFLRESVLAFRDAIRRRRSNYYLVIANANEAVRDEFLELVRPRGDVLMSCVLDGEGSVIDATTIGDLDPKQRVTYDLVRDLGETDAGELMRDHSKNEGVQRTAWNNRLAALASLGLVVELSQGRAKRYKRLFERV